MFKTGSAARAMLFAAVASLPLGAVVAADAPGDKASLSDRSYAPQKVVYDVAVAERAAGSLRSTRRGQ